MLHTPIHFLRTTNTFYLLHSSQLRGLFVSIYRHSFIRVLSGRNGGDEALLRVGFLSLLRAKHFFPLPRCGKEEKINEELA